MSAALVRLFPTLLSEREQASRHAAVRASVAAAVEAGIGNPAALERAMGRPLGWERPPVGEEVP